MSVELRNSLWNNIYLSVISNQYEEYNWQGNDFGIIAKLGHLYFFKLPIDEIPNSGERYVKWLRSWFFNEPWFKVYDFVDWLANVGVLRAAWRESARFAERADNFRSVVNDTLVRENSAYRFVNQYLVAISNECEIDEIKKTIALDGEFEIVATHLSVALKLLSDRTAPDFRNSIKEAISAVEAAARLAVGEPKATLGEALKKLGRGASIHPSLKEGFLKIYGWTNDAEGIRHAMMDAPAIDLADARLMLVSCSAFANYLVDKRRSDA